MEGVEKKLNKVHDDLVAIKTWMGSEFGYNNVSDGNVNRNINEIRIDIKEIKKELQHFIYGNGSPGIKNDIISLKSRVDIIAKIMWGVIGIVMSVIGKIAYDSWVWFTHKGG